MKRVQQAWSLWLNSYDDGTTTVHLTNFRPGARGLTYEIVLARPHRTVSRRAMARLLLEAARQVALDADTDHDVD